MAPLAAGDPVAAPLLLVTAALLDAVALAALVVAAALVLAVLLVAALLAVDVAALEVTALLAAAATLVDDAALLVAVVVLLDVLTVAVGDAPFPQAAKTAVNTGAASPRANPRWTKARRVNCRSSADCAGRGSRSGATIALPIRCTAAPASQVRDACACQGRQRRQ